MFEKYDAYKDSGVEWLGQVPTHWHVTRIKNLFRLVMDFAPKNNNEELLSVYTDIGVKPRKELEERGNKASTTDGYLFVQKGDIVVNKLLAWMGAIGLSEYNGVTSPAYDILRPKVPMISKFYHNMFRMPVFSSELKKHSRGIMDMRLRLYFDKFGDVLVPSPPFEEQTAIIQFLDQKTAEIDQAIAIKEQQIALLNERKQIVIQKAVTQGLDPNVTIQDSGVEWIGQIPEHWNTITKLKHIASLKGRQGWQGLKADEYIDEGPYVVSSAHFDGLDINWDKCPHVSIERYKMDAHIQLNIGDILLMKDGAKMGKMAYISNLPDLACLNSHLLLIRSLKTQDEFFFDSKYMLYFMLSEKFQDYVQVKGTGTTFMGISQESIGNFPIALPSLYEQIQIASFLDKRMLELEKGKDLLLTQIEKLKEYKTTLINDAVTGKIKVA